MKKGNTPRPYLSWSQLNLFESSPKQYIKVYFEGKKIENQYTEFGRKVADALDTNDYSGDKDIERLKIFMPTYQFTEFEIKANIGHVPLLGRLDGFNEKGLEIGEGKTGKKWTQKMVDNHGQLTFYALLVFLKFKSFPEKISLHWLRTIENDGEVSLTGELQTFTTTRYLSDLVSMSKRCKEAWEGIKKLSQKFNGF